jgi:2-polyprenyl-6-methoxyphenol hydroxylase-like FAD-dependent oxidoreductase
MSGLLAARVLSDHFAQVTIVERDRLSADGLPRRGVPQAGHVHALLPRGAAVLDELFPGLLDELVASGVPVTDDLSAMHFEVNGHLFFHDPHAEGSHRTDGKALYQPSRPFLEARVLRRVRGLRNVDVMDGCDVENLTSTSIQTRVTGARIAPREVSAGRRDLPADLVVVATGRSARAPAWLKRMGYVPPAEEEVPVDIRYVTQRVRPPDGSVDRLRGIIVGGTAARPMGAGCLAQEGGTWVVTLFGYAGHHPPLDRPGWLAFGDRVLPRAFAEALREAEPLEDRRQHRFPTNLRRRYDRLPRFPGGLLVTGDALCSFNPVYGQGMTVAALEALALRDALRGDWEGLAPRFFKAAAKPVGDAWRFAVGGDLALPETIVPGVRPLPVRAVNQYVDRVQSAAETDPVMAWRFLDVTSFEEPAGALFGADSLRRLATDRRARRRTEAAAVAAQVRQGWP